MLPKFKISLHNIDPEEINDVLEKVEKSFGFKFVEVDLNHVKTFGELCDVIMLKVEGIKASDCTSQQAFYKIRTAISNISRFDKSSIFPETKLSEIFPKNSRVRQIKALQKELSTKLDLLDIKNWLAWTNAAGITLSLVLLCFHWQSGVPGLIAFAVIRKISYTFFARELKVETIGDLTEKFGREHYNLARRKPGTVNKDEIVQTVKSLFKADLILEESALERSAVIGF